MVKCCDVIGRWVLIRINLVLEVRQNTTWSSNYHIWLLLKKNSRKDGKKDERGGEREREREHDIVLTSSILI